jgi:streptogramin lyase
VELPASSPTSPVVFNASQYQFSEPSGIVIDGSGNVFVVSNDGGTITEIPASNPNSPKVFPSSGPSCTGISGLYVGISIDSHGNVWASNATNNSVTELVKAAAPTTVPLR